MKDTPPTFRIVVIAQILEANKRRLFYAPENLVSYTKVDTNDFDKLDGLCKVSVECIL